ncbi:MAG: hypothetical protein M3133_08685 [Actinomycetota bacterium]|nr:hypothetical protein [Actinomycetota bacterium]
MSEESIRTAGILLITVPAVAFGGATLLRLIWGREPGYLAIPSARTSGGPVTPTQGC